MARKRRTKAEILAAESKGLGGVQTPRIHSKLNDLPSKGQEMIDFATEIGIQLMDWQKFVAIHAHKVKEDNRWATNEVGLLCARQQGKSTLMMLRILTGMFVWHEGLQLASAHRLTTSLETFRQIVTLIEQHPELEKEVKKIRWQLAGGVLAGLTGVLCPATLTRGYYEMVVVNQEL